MTCSRGGQIVIIRHSLAVRVVDKSLLYDIADPFARKTVLTDDLFAWGTNRHYKTQLKLGSDERLFVVKSRNLCDFHQFPIFRQKIVRVNKKVGVEKSENWRIGKS